MQIRRATPQDWPTIVDFNDRLAIETEDHVLDRTILEAGVKAALADETKALYFVAETEAGIVGQIMLTFEWSDWRNGQIWWLQSVYVTAEQRGKGVFRAIFSHVEEAAKAAGAVGIRLYAVHTNEPALATYRRSGFDATPYIVLERFF